MSLTLLHTADLHLGAPLTSFGSYAATRREEFRQTFSRILDLAIQRSIPVLLIAGDLFDDIDVDRSLVGWVCEELRGYTQTGGQVVIIPGTHDHMEGGNWALKTLLNVHLLESPLITEPLKLNIGEETVFIYGFSFQHGQTPPDWRPMMQRRDGEGFHIGMLHGALRKNHEWNIPEKDLPFTLLDLVNLRLDYVALGHYHQPQLLEHEGKTIASYPGSPEGKNFKETGERVVHLVTFSNHNSPPEIEQVVVQTKSLVQTSIDVSGLGTLEDLISRFSSEGNEDVLARITLTGVAEFPIDVEKLHQSTHQHFGYLELRNETTLIESSWIDHLKDELTIRGAFVRRALKELEAAKTLEDRTTIRMAMHEVLAEFQRRGQ
ncbi:MAG TPA: DNA repair exonuclease [Bdellovibrionota bacterium]|nr:DNA repair exonuclease [Bdellovibrionota bacterium]